LCTSWQKVVGVFGTLHRCAALAIKSEILLAQTATGSKEEITEDDELNCFKISENS
jgi:hypothetical protein